MLSYGSYRRTTNQPVFFAKSHVAQARSQGGVGGVVRPPPVAHPKDFVPPFSNFVPPFSNFVPPFSNFVPPFSNFVPPSAILFHPLAILFHPSAILFHPSAILFHPWTWNMWMTSHGQCPRGGACECPRVGAFFKLMTSHGQCPRGGCL